MGRRLAIPAGPRYTFHMNLLRIGAAFLLATGLPRALWTQPPASSSSEIKLQGSITHFRQRLRDTEARNNVKCWATFRRTEDMLATVPLEPEAAHTRARLAQNFAGEIWSRADKLEPRSSGRIGRGSVERAVRLYLKIGILLGHSGEARRVRGRGSSAAEAARLDVEDLERTAESWRTLLSFAQKAPQGLRDLDPSAADFLASRAAVFSLSLIQAASQLCREFRVPKITSSILERADSLLHFRELFYTFTPIGWAMDKGQALPQSVWYAQDKIAGLEDVNGKVGEADRRRTMEGIAGMPLEPAAAAYLDKTVLPELARTLWLAAQSELPKGHILISGEGMHRVIQRLFPYADDENENIIFFPRSRRPVVLQAFQCDAFRDDAAHWRAILDLLTTEVDVEAKSPSRLSVPLDPYAMEELSELLSDLPVLLLRQAAEHSGKAARGVVDPAAIRAAFSSLMELSQRASQTPPPASRTPGAVQDTIPGAPPPAGPKPLFEDRTATAGLQRHPLLEIYLSLKTRYWWAKQPVKGYFRSVYRKLRGRPPLPPMTMTYSPTVDKFTDGASVEDYDGDGYPDMFLGGMGGGLYRNLGGMRFESVTVKAGLGGILHRHPRGGFFGDFDNDGLPDLYVSLSMGPSSLFRNRGDGTFEDVTERSGIRTKVQNMALWLDYDRDGFLDLYILNRADLLGGAIPTIGDATNADPNFLYRNNRDGTFTDVTAEAGVGDTRWALAGASFDYDQDGWPDIFVVNDIGKDVLYRNLGNGRFQEVTEEAGVADYGAGMGVSVGDFNQDGWPDLYVTNIGMYSPRTRYVRPNAKTPLQTSVKIDQYFRIKQANRLWRNNRNGTFTDVVEEKMGPLQTGWGWNGMFLDFDNDGHLDIHISNGSLPFHIFYHDERNVLIRQDPKTGLFRDVSAVSGVDFPGNSRGGAYADFDRDGFLDLVVVGLHPPKIFRNASGENGNHWISVRVKGAAPLRGTDGVGASVRVVAGDLVQTDWVGSQGGAFSSQCGKEIHFGLGRRARVDRLTVRWPSGRTKTLTNLRADHRIVLTEPG